MCWNRMFKSNRFLIGIIILLLGWIIFLHFQTVTNPNDVTLILAFVGILATFTVLSNFAQVIEIKNEFNKKVNDMNTNIQVISKTVELLSTSSSGKIDPRSYQVLGIDHNAIVENWYVLLKTVPTEKKTIDVFVKQFRDEYCKNGNNINLVDDASIYPLITKYPLEGDEYLKVADHFVAMVTFDSNDALMYPFQDIKYKELGGKNRKKHPVE